MLRLIFAIQSASRQDYLPAQADNLFPDHASLTIRINGIAFEQMLPIVYFKQGRKKSTNDHVKQKRKILLRLMFGLEYYY